jgi:ABC-type branched-subunit amino acid transport system substrate-binding protein/predicted negative regulator of RcsB-dependent stress response
MLAHAHNPFSISAWLSLMVAIALALVLGVGLMQTQSGEAEAADPVKVSPPNPPALNQAKHLIEKGDSESAAIILRRFLTTTPPPEHLDDTYLLLGAALYGMKDYGEALRYLNQLQTEFPESDLVDRGKLMLARTHTAMGNIDLALPLLTQVRTTAPDDTTKREALQLTAEALAQKKDYVRAIHTLLEGMAGSSDAQMTEAREQIRQFITEKLDKKGLIRVRDAYPRSYPGDLASLRLIDYYIGRGEDHLAERETRHFLAAFPAHPFVPKASESLELIKSRLKANQYFIAAVLPLSGHLSTFANDVLEGIQLAVERAREQLGVPSVGLIVKDLDVDRPGFLDDLSTLLHDDRPLAVIGPMLSKNLPVMAEMAQKTRVPLITPAATLPNVRRLGNYLFSTSLTYAMQAERIATYAAKDQGYRRFAILHPDTVYGRELARLFAQEVRRLEGEIISIESFKEGETDFGLQIQRLKAEDLKKYGLAVPVDLPRQPGKPLGRNEKRVLYTPGFDAIFIPSRSHEIGLLAAQLAYHDIKVPLLGTNGWNSQDFARTADRTVDGATFVDGFFVDSPNPAVQEFVQRYYKRFQTPPSLFAMQGYDAARAILEGVRHGATSGEALHDFLMTQRNLPTLAGPASFGPDGTLHRPLFLLRVKQGKFVQLD